MSLLSQDFRPENMNAGRTKLRERPSDTLEADMRDLDLAEQEASQGLAFGWAAFFIAICAMVAAAGAIGFAVTRSGSSSSRTGGSSGPAYTVEVTLADLSMTPKHVTVPAGRPLAFKINNKGALEHDFWVESGEHTDMIGPGKSATLTVDTVSDGLMAYCNVPGHRAAGMQMTIHVDGAAASKSTASSAETSAGSASALDFNAKAPDGFVARDPNAPVPSNVHEHKITLDAIEKEIAVAPGVTQKLWTFNGTTPGPILRGKLGDVFTVTLRNRGTMGHSIDFHASKVARSDEMRTIMPGEQLVYRFEATHSGIFMYHCGTAPALHHIGNGMFGALIIDPPNLPHVDKEYVLVQSELYLGPNGKEGDLTKMLANKWDAVVFNGYVNQYRDQPIQVQANPTLRVWELDAGPSENTTVHIVGTIFDSMYKEGAYTLQPGPMAGGAQALDLQPAQGGFVEFSLDEVGYYPIVTHKFSNASQGAMGLLRAGDAKMPAGASH
jgi:nitrite reductase (NO-forming)